ncbi:hypothetical protein [Caviibacterium pharyngocola]|uniref:DUF1186 domain-containing protein n=1 Tax=Caviibacterium pharyngocola TaxID=28159 RepID=A0A2M8RZ39_9PAST|nr:hypothetical protein [Caviibacterium pharyngocola]PJG84134.1 hypothetical protein CVP04_00010 [Caviibacterium pharyngocola]
MNVNEIDDLLYSIPEQIDYTTIIDEVDLEDIPKERVNKLIDILNNYSNYEFYQVFKAGGLLCHWGIEEGFIYISNLLLSSGQESIRKEFLEGYDYKYILSAIQGYIVCKIHTEEESIARNKIYPCIKEIINLAKTKFFSIAGFYYLIFERYNEYVPLIEDYLGYIIKHPQENYWNIHDTTKLLLKMKSNVVEKIFEENGKQLSDFGLEENSNSPSKKEEKKEKGYFWWLKW